MAGYIMNMDSLDSIKRCFESGVYSTRFNKIKNEIWNLSQEGTFADFLSMKEGDHIYFFHKRLIYGVGCLVNISNDKVSDCKYWNFINANLPVSFSDKDILDLEPLVSELGANQRCFCVFEPCPSFFGLPVDMDEALQSNPEAFKMLRADWKVSFIKIDDVEDVALYQILIRKNLEVLNDSSGWYKFDVNIQKALQRKVDRRYQMMGQAFPLLAANDKGSSNHEMALEAFLCSDLQSSNSKSSKSRATDILGRWSYVSHQVIASPFKPIDYMDKMDIFAYKNIDNYDIIEKYGIFEIKKSKAHSGDLDQLMKYVDFVAKEYAHGDYSMIEAYLIAFDFSKNIDQESVTTRNFTKGSRPIKTETWNKVKLVKYFIDETGISFEEFKA
ncbi:hypothetical protein [Dubosiella newyorkensis]|uniref:hypothetical protein n=1 Tax=Dubosiella newyorkensis TaxID=1862672 RepID=UPI0023F0D871|nr:hypothetical protein [Dubosiella newyorkensis]